MPSTRSLVTGGAGFIGSHIVRRLLELGHDVRVIDNLITGFRHNLDEVADRIDFRIADIRDPRSCAEAVEGVDVIFHVAALPSVPRSMADPVGTHETNVNGTLNLLEAGRHAGVKRLVYSSSSSAYGDTPALPKVESMEPLPRSPYAAAKLSGEMYTLAYARAGLIEGVALRYFNVFGPRQDPNGPYAAIIPLLFRSAITGSPITIFGDGRQTRDFTFVDNAVDANLLSAQRDSARVSGQVVNVGAGSRTSLLELVELVEEISGTAIKVRHAPDRPGDVRDSQAGLARAESVLGYTPAVNVREGIKRLWAWYAANPGALEAIPAPTA
jgi:UDP-glucose 4-epimerase